MKHNNLKIQARNKDGERWKTEKNILFCNILQNQLQYTCSFCLTCRTEEEGLRFFKVLVHYISDGCLCVGKGGEGLFVSRTHVGLNVIKQ